MSLTCFAQDSLNIDSKQTNGVDSIHASHTTFSSNTLEDATKAEGDSAYIKEVQRFYPTVTYELPLSGTSGILACTDGEYKITITYNGTEMLISLAQDLGI